MPYQPHAALGSPRLSAAERSDFGLMSLFFRLEIRCQPRDSTRRALPRLNKPQDLPQPLQIPLQSAPKPLIHPPQRHRAPKVLALANCGTSADGL